MDMNSRQNRHSDEIRADTWRTATDLHRNYRRIGISAVAAAVRYAGGDRTPAARSKESEDAAA